MSKPLLSPTLPASFLRDGFLSPEQARAAAFKSNPRKLRRLLIGTDGPSNSGKSEFILSAPGPGIVLALDRGFDSMLDNQTPPSWRRSDYAFKVIQAPLATAAVQQEFLTYWRAFYAEYTKALANPDARTIGLDGDSDSWELQRLAEFGQLQQVISIRYAGVNAARRAMIAKAWDSGKIIIATNKLEREYKPILNPVTKEMVLGNDGKPLREWDGKSFERQGFKDQDYLWSIQLRHLYDPDRNKWGIKILKCKADPSLGGYELWGDDCNFQGLVQTVYPQVPLSEWGY